MEQSGSRPSVNLPVSSSSENGRVVDFDDMSGASPVWPAPTGTMTPGPGPAHAHAMSLPYRYGYRYVTVHLSTRPYRYALRRHQRSALPLLGSVPRSPEDWNGDPEEHGERQTNHPGTADNSYLISLRTAAFVPRGTFGRQAASETLHARRRSAFRDAVLPRGLFQQATVGRPATNHLVLLHPRIRLASGRREIMLHPTLPCARSGQ